MSTIAPWVTARQSAQRVIATKQGTMLLQRLNRIFRTRWIKPALLTEKRTKQPLICFN